MKAGLEKYLNPSVTAFEKIVTELIIVMYPVVLVSFLADTQYPINKGQLVY